MAAPNLYEYHLTIDDKTVVYHQASNAYELMRKGVIVGKHVTLLDNARPLQRATHIKE